MSLNKNAFEQPANHLLAALPVSDYERLIPHLKLVTLSNRQVLYQPGEPIIQVYFPNKAVVSIITTMEDGSTVEAGLVSNEGMVGIPVILGDDTTITTASVQIPDSAMQMMRIYSEANSIGVQPLKACCCAMCKVCTLK
ncbi:MAG: Crp/Fnr family transcriptional regulator [Nostoc sp. CmiVER01]|uniref:Crp/Fnr family transcriptional regulator n=1 Tax=Nostoc sp. CmiVER01 TaxID=3075384 RepID=UPI003A100E37